MKTKIALLVFVLVLLAATGAGWKWPKPGHQTAGWTWDDSTAQYVEN
jgi:hypothetical protein